LIEDKESHYRYIVSIEGSSDITTVHPIDREIFAFGSYHTTLLVPTNSEVYFKDNTNTTWGIKPL
jgi:hypothetical protein